MNINHHTQSSSFCRLDYWWY